MAYSTITATLNYTGQPNVSMTIASTDFQDVQTATQSIVKNAGFWTNSSVNGPPDTFYPSTSILFLRVS